MFVAADLVSGIGNAVPEAQWRNFVMSAAR
jgi:hypothetical protein